MPEGSRGLLQVRCVECDRIIASTGEVMGLFSLLIACHATYPHTSHTFELVSEMPYVGPKHPLVIECLHPKCPVTTGRMIELVPIELVGALTLVFHSSHEGHRIRVTYGDDYDWQSP